ncbi:thiamine pyrophosphate-binding protein [Flagellimonas meridianipacifica]|uniref:Thiamine pyrophosphate-dependent acetolactate synthase large subunit-like protein n=1 Tax=Flagellimonas meridianipacifica TaxID=1080225 RepID=A0A2T0MJZ5_9FLAO|nr:thiamine pyrophosphate-binding protein [Allomuricauda pacifica]PRX57918.1 thiamine pyrophosphate-dependent acetolactate synthase large subunit-like protein [Allomuricauda pacifica]
MDEKKRIWYKVLDNKKELPEGRVKTVTAAHKGICLTHFEGKFSALDNRCPHQGGPLGEGSIENGMLRCPWHGWDFHPCTGLPPGGYDDGIETFEVKEEGEAIFVGVPEEAEHETTVSDIMAETMVNWGVTKVFGMVGHSNLGFADAMKRQEQKGKLNFYGIRHEGAAAFAASAYGKLTGKPAACFSIAGPGATNMFTGMWDAKVDRAPLLALTGQVATQVVGTGNFQEVDLVQAFGSVAEFNHRVQSDSKHSELMSLAIKHAILKRDVSHLTFPDEVQERKAKPNAKPQTPEKRITSLEIAPPKESVKDAVNLIKKSKRPVIIIGHGARAHKKAIIKFAESLNAPVVTTFKGKGLIPDNHPLGGGVLGRSGTPIASWFMNESDVLIVFGASFSNHTGITPKKPIIQVDFDPLALSKFHKVEVAVWGEISRTLEIFESELEDGVDTIDQTNEIAERWKIWRSEKAKRLLETSDDGVSSIAVFDAMDQLTPEDAVMCVDVGNNAYSFGRYFESKEHDFLMSGYLGSIGFALPASIGAWTAVGSSRPVVAVAGDGGLCQYLAEITTLVKYNMPVKLIVLNNHELGKISKEQRAGEFDVWKTSLSNPNFADFAVSCGAWGKRVEKQEDLMKTMKSLFEQPGPAVLEVITDVNLI